MSETPAPHIPTVLVVDDTESNLDLARVLFEDLNCHLLTACDGLQALAIVQAQPVDLIFMDIQLPFMDGCETARKIHALGPGFSAIPIVAMTAGSADERGTWLKAGMVDHVAKPVDWDQLCDVFQRYQRGTRCAAPVSSRKANHLPT